jgi:hypothetical protein
MFDNHLYNLFLQLVQEHKSLWRINHHYIQDASGCQECQEFWEKLREDKERHIQELEGLIKKHWS